MPNYTYRCENEDCKYEFTKSEGINEDHIANCIKCGGKTIRIFTPTSAIWKCSGVFGKSK